MVMCAVVMCADRDHKIRLASDKMGTVKHAYNSWVRYLPCRIKRYCKKEGRER